MVETPSGGSENALRSEILSFFLKFLHAAGEYSTIPQLACYWKLLRWSSFLLIEKGSPTLVNGNSSLLTPHLPGCSSQQKIAPSAGDNSGGTSIIPGSINPLLNHASDPQPVPHSQEMPKARSKGLSEYQLKALFKSLKRWKKRFLEKFSTLKITRRSRGSSSGRTIDISVGSTRNNYGAFNSAADDTGTPGQLSSPSTWDTDDAPISIDIMFHAPGDSISRRRGILDTGSFCNLISTETLSDLGLRASEYTGGPIQPIGQVLQPLGKITLRWYVLKKNVTYKTEFLVIPDDIANFDVLLGRGWIKQSKALKRNIDVFHLDRLPENRWVPVHFAQSGPVG